MALILRNGGSQSLDRWLKEPRNNHLGSIVDVSQLQYMLEKAKGYGYKRAGFILDRGYFSKENIQYMDECGYDFVIMVRGMASFVKELVLENKGTFEMHREYGIRKYKVYGMTVKKQMYATDKKERYFHIFYSDQKAAAEREQTEGKIGKRLIFRYDRKIPDYFSVAGAP